MAQSSDRNDSKRNDEDGSTQAEQILDSIIEHIESTDKPAIDVDQNPTNVAQSGDPQASATLAPAERQEQQVSARASNSDFQNIEKRAAALASKLGGAGLSYSKGVNKHLEQKLELDEEKVEEITPVVKAAIHQDDLEVDNEWFGRSSLDASELAQQELVELNETQTTQQQNNVNEWDAELQAQDNIETAGPLDVALLEVDLNIPDPQIETIRAPLPVDEKKPVDPPEVIQAMEQADGTVEHDLELQNIQKNIEELSSSMNRHDTDLIVQDDDVPEQPIREMLVSPTIPFEEMELRIATLETHIVKHLDDVSLLERKMGDSVREIVKSQTQETVRESFEMSDVFRSMKAELSQAAEQRHLQDVRMSDSLDALHDALQDIGDRVKTMEAGSANRPQPIEMKIASGGGIVSAVLGSSAAKASSIVDTDQEEPSGTIENKSHMTSKATEPVTPNPNEELPAWLSDVPQDLHAEQHDTPMESADIFAPNSDQLDVPLGTAIDTNIQVKAADEFSPSGIIEPEIMAPSSLIEQELHREIIVEKSALAPNAELENLGKTVTERQSAKDVVESVTERPGGDDFLRSARAAARAANERAREIELLKKSGDKKSKSIAKIGNFIESAKQKDTGVEREPIVEKVKSAPKNSLFTDKVQGPNSLLVFTSLILFGTSALLLYGMSRNNVDTGSVVKLNAVERTAEQQSIGPGSKIRASRENKFNENKKAHKVSGDERSNLVSNVNVAAVQPGRAKRASETQTGQDNINSSRAVVFVQDPYAIRYTGSTNGAKEVVKPGSLFDQYISFSTPSVLSDAAGANSTNLRAKANAPAKIDGPTGLLNSASSGDVQAQYEVARRFGQGIGVQKSPAISVEWYEKSANAGYAPAIYRLATMYERGKGVAKDYKRAMTLYISAAEKGNVKAMHNLAVLYTGGNLGKADYSNAISWYNKAAQYGVKDSQFNLAIIYQNGMGGKLDLEQAYKWYSLAARAGDKEAKGMVEDLRRDFSSSKREKLDENLRIWKAKTPDKNANVVSQYRKASLQGSASQKT